MSSADPLCLFSVALQVAIAWLSLALQLIFTYKRIVVFLDVGYLTQNDFFLVPLTDMQIL